MGKNVKPEMAADGRVDGTGEAGGAAGNEGAVAATAPALDIGAVAALFGDLLAKDLAPLKEQVQTLQSQADKQKQATPRFERQRPAEDKSGLAARRRMFSEAMAQKNTAFAGVRAQVPIGTHGMRLAEHIQIQFAPKFQPGDEVRINPEAIREGADRLWSAVLDHLHIDGYGRVRKRLWLTKVGQWKYKVHVPGYSKPEGDGFGEYELLAA